MLLCVESLLMDQFIKQVNTILFRHELITSFIVQASIVFVVTSSIVRTCQVSRILRESPTFAP